MTTLASDHNGTTKVTTQAAPLRVLVVEDDPDTCAGVRIRLAYEGHEVFAVGDGRNAVSLAQKVRPDVVLLDLGLPGAGGLDVLARLQAIRPDLPVIVVSAWEEQIYEDRCLQKGAAMFLQKPATGAQLAAAVRSVVDRD